MNRFSGAYLQKWLAAAFCVYAVLNLISMATMSIGLASLALPLLLGIPVIFVGFPWQNSGVRNFGWASLFLTWACAMSLMIAWFFPLVFKGQISEIHFLADITKAFYLFLPLFFVAGLANVGTENRSRILAAWLITFGLLGLVGAVQHFTGWPRPQFIPGNETRFHATLFLGHHLSVASIFLFPTFFCLEAALSPREVVDEAIAGGGAGPAYFLARWPRAIWIALSVLGILVLFLTYSRNAWISVPIGLTVWMLWALPKRWKFGVAALFCLLVGGFAIQPAIQKRLGDALGISTRAEIWEANLFFLRERPLTGTGWHHNLELSGIYLLEKHPETNDVFSGHAHNNLLEMLASTGILGTAAWLIWCGWIFVLLYRLATQHGHRAARGFFCAWVVFHIQGLTQVNFWESKVLHQIMWTTAWVLLWTIQQNREGARRSGA
ncbi:MAG: O-antigen ligase family protein [Bdellovibrionota bacterium]